jgi:hypothetical protein
MEETMASASVIFIDLILSPGIAPHKLDKHFLKSSWPVSAS